MFAGWAPSGTAFEYAKSQSLVLVTVDASTRKLASTKELLRRDALLLDNTREGWSPDGRHIGASAGCCTGKPAQSIQIVDVQSDRLSVLHPFRGADYFHINWWQ